MSHKFDPMVSVFTTKFGGWIVGSAAAPGAIKPRDVDIIIPLSQWAKASLVIPKHARPNTFGGWKFVSNGVEIDVWPGELSDVMSSSMTRYVYQPHLGIRYMRG